jgi:hypothetical protein
MAGPEAPTPGVYATVNANDPVELYEGPLELERPLAPLRGTGSVRLAWVPSPRISFELESDPVVGLQFGDDATLHLLAKGVRVPVWVQATNTRLGPPDKGETITSGLISDSADVGNPAAGLTHVIFHLVNFVKFEGKPLRAWIDAAEHHWRGRLEFDIGQWHVTLDQRHDLGSGGSPRLMDEGGYAFTHTGMLRRGDGATFSAADALRVLNVIGWATSFASGRRSYPILPVGFQGDAAVWEQWRVPTLDSWAPRTSWFPAGSATSLQSIAQGAMRRLSDEDWRDTAMFVLGSFVGGNGATSLDPSLVIAQMGLELMSWALLVREGSAVSAEGFERLRAHDRLRLLLSTASVPRDVPATMQNLSARARSENIDGPGVLTYLRNRIVHPPRQRGVAFRAQDLDELFEGNTLACWYLELAILRFLGYDGRYVNRTVVGPSSAAEQPVPWAR